MKINHIPVKNITDLKKFIDDENKLDKGISKLINSNNKLLIKKWKKENRSILREFSYPDKIEFIDANVKLSSDDPKIRKKGQEQLDKYYKDCLAVKEKYK